MKNFRVRIFGLLFVLLISIQLSAQNRHLRKAEDAFKTGEYFKAVEYYEKAYDKMSNKKEKGVAAFYIGECYRRIDDLGSAQRWYRKAVKYDYKEPISILHYANLLVIDEEYEDALEQYKRYKELVPDDKRGDNGIRSIELIKEWKSNPSGYIVAEVDDLNSSDAEFSPAYGRSKSEIYFTSNRESAMGDNSSDITGKPFADIFEAQKDRKGKWSEPVPVQGAVNTKGSEGTPLLLNGGATMYFTVCKQQEGANLGCRIYVSRKGMSGWSDPKELEMNLDSNITAAHPAVTKDERTMYFVSNNILNGKGGKDIWVTQRTSMTAKWKKPVNLGNSVNTAGDESFPFIREDGVLFFASDGHPGMGGMDIYKATKSGSKWRVENMKPPINSNAHDFGICFFEDENVGFFSTTRERDDDIFSFKLPPLIFVLKGKVINSATDMPLKGATVKLQGSNGKELDVKSADDGTFRFNLDPKTDYAVYGSMTGYLKAKRNESTKGIKSSKTFHTILDLPPIESAIELPNIEYDLGKKKLRPESEVSLDKLVETLNINDNITIELMANTDFRGGDDYNMKLSQGRANSVIKYLISKGIKENRLTAQGYGETNPKKINSKLARQYDFLRKGDLLSEEFIKALDNEEQKEICHQLNRRTEFKVLSDDYGLNTTPFGG
ncbi:MAG: OmpA family protein [Bacteroidota bacterium]|nr:OmpA family protein [Bacteroidota bacterium]